MLDKLTHIKVDGKLAEKTNKVKKRLKKQLHETADLNNWCDSIIAANKELDNMMEIAPEPAFFGLGEEHGAFDFSDRKAIFESLNFCGCGMSDEVLSFIKQALAHIKYRREADSSQAVMENEAKVFGSAGAATFFYYWADREQLIDHGSSVPGWLDFKGELLLSKLAELGY